VRHSYGVSPDRGSHGHQVLVKKPATIPTPTPPPTPLGDTATTTDTAATAAAAASTTNDATPPPAAPPSSDAVAAAVAPKSNVRQSKRLTKEMKRVYGWMLDRYQDDITLSFHRSDPDPFTRLCTEIIGG
jgi:hypothetical protein